MSKLTPGQAKAKHAAAFDEFYRAYPKRVAPSEAARAFAEICESGVDPVHLIAKARAYAMQCDPNDLTYVPSPHSWLRQGRYDDQDLFCNKRESEREWLRQQWRDANVSAVESRFHVTMEKVYPPDDLTDPDAIRLWYKATAQEWIAKIAQEKMGGDE